MVASRTGGCGRALLPDCPALHETTADKITASTCSPYATDNNLYIHRNAAIWMTINPINHLSSACMFTARCSATPPNLQTHRRQGGGTVLVKNPIPCMHLSTLQMSSHKLNKRALPMLGHASHTARMLVKIMCHVA